MPGPGTNAPFPGGSSGSPIDLGQDQFFTTGGPTDSSGGGTNPLDPEIPLDRDIIPDPPPGGGLPPIPPPDTGLPPVPEQAGSGANMLPGQLFDRGEFQQSSDAALAGAFGLRPGIDDAQTQSEINQFEQDLSQRGAAGQKQLEARLQQMGILTSGITGQRGVDLQTALQQERGRFRTNTLGELERRRFGESLAQNQNLQSLLGQRFNQGGQDADRQQGVFQQNIANQDRNTQMILSMLGLGGVGFPQGSLPGGAKGPNKSAAAPAGQFTGEILKAILGGGP